MGRRTIVARLKHPQHPRLKLYKHRRSRFWQASTFLDGRKLYHSLKTDDPDTALAKGETWYRRALKSSIAQAKRHPIDRLTTDPTVGECFASFRLTLPKAERPYVDTKWGALSSFWQTMPIGDVSAKKVREYFAQRRKRKTQYGEPPSNGTLHKDRTLLGQILKHAAEEGQIAAVPLLPHPGRIRKSPRPWFTRDEFDHLLAVAADRQYGHTFGARVERKREELYHFIVFAVESMMRIGEIRALTVRQVQYIRATKTTPEHLLVDVVGKRGHRQTIVGGLAVTVFKLRAENLKPSDRLWTTSLREGFSALLKAAHLEEDAFGNARNLKSLRSTGISFRVLAEMPNPDLVTIARAAGTSIAQLNDFYLKRLTAQHGTRTLTKSVLLDE